MTRTLAGDRAAATEDIKAHQAYRSGWACGFKAATDLLGIRDDEELEVFFDGHLTVHDALLDPLVDRMRDELAQRRAYRTPARTPEQIRALVDWSWRTGRAQDAYARAGIA